MSDPYENPLEEEEFHRHKVLKVCPKCGWNGKTQLIFCWNFRKLGYDEPCKDEHGDHQRLEVAE